MQQVLHTILAHDQSQDIVELVQLLLDDEDDEDEDEDQVVDVCTSLVTTEKAKICDSQDGAHGDVLQLMCPPILMELVTPADLLVAQGGDQEHVVRVVNLDSQRVFLFQTNLRIIHGIEI